MMRHVRDLSIDYANQMGKGACRHVDGGKGVVRPNRTLKPVTRFDRKRHLESENMKIVSLRTAPPQIRLSSFIMFTP